MRYCTTTKIIIDQRKLQTLLRLGCSKDIILDLISGKKITKTGDDLIDENLDTLVDIKTFKNWGGARKGAGRKRNQLEFQDDNQVDNQDAIQVGDKDISLSTNSRNLNSRVNINNIYTTRTKNPSLEDVLAYARQQNDLAGVGGFACSDDTATEFWSYYEGIGWVVPNDAKTPIVNWQPFLRKWATNPKFRVSVKKPDDDNEPFYL